MASNRMNEVMKWLTILSTMFIPMTFLAGVYGMNFDYLPELHVKYAYPLFWLICLTQAAVLFWYFRRKGWIGRR
jgi:magnesium transporter